MKLFMATMGLGIGGAETHIVELCKELHRQGHDVAVCSNGGVYVQELLDAGIRHYTAPMHRRHFSSMWQARKLLKAAIQAEQPDVVHAHARIPAFLCGSLQKSLKFHFVTTAHGVFNPRGLLRLMTNWGQHTLAVSEDIHSYLTENYCLSPDQISLTINGVDTEKFRPTRPNTIRQAELGLTSAPVVTHVCRLDDTNDLVARQLIEIAPQLDSVIPNVQILLVGGGDVYDELLQLAQQTNKKLGRPCIHMPGPRTDIADVLALTTLFVGVSRAALEAMAVEVPTLLAGAQGYGGLFQPELLPSAQESNFCFRGAGLPTPETLLQDIVSALQLSPQQMDELGKLGRETVRTHYSVERMAQDCLTAYGKILPRKNILISGYYGFANAGDDAILQSIHQELEHQPIDLTVLSQNPAQTQADYGLKSLPRFRLWTVISALRKCDVLLSGGGSLLQDRTSTRSLLYYLAVIWGAKCFKKPVMLYANGIGPVTKSRNRVLVRRAVEGATVVTLRDQSSCDELRAMGVTRPDLHVTADPVFRLSPASDSVAEELLQRVDIAEGAPFVAVSVRSWMNTEGFVQGLAQLCDHLHNVHGLEVLFLLMQPSHDENISREVMAAMSAPSHILAGSIPPAQLMAVLSKSKLTLAMRLHTLIFSARVGVPMLGLNYDPKVESYLQELEMPSAGDVTAFDAAAAIQLADDMMANYENYHQKLHQRSQALTQAAEENISLLLSLSN